jgi:hypothetical protein
VTIVSAILVPGSNPHPDTFFLLIFMLLLFQQSLHKENLIYDFKTVTCNFPHPGLTDYLLNPIIM